MLSLPFILALVGAGVGLLVGILIFGQISEAIECPASGGGGGGGGNGNGTVTVYDSFIPQHEKTIRTNKVIDVLGDGSQTSATIGQTVEFDGEDLTAIRVKIDVSGSAGTARAVLWDSSGVIGTDPISSFTELAVSNTVDINDWENNDYGRGIWQFNFAGAGTTNLSGTYLIGIEYVDLGGDNVRLIILDDSETYPTPYLVSGDCWATVETRAEDESHTVEFCTTVNTANDDLQIKVYGNKDGLSEKLIFDSSGEQGPSNRISGRHGGDTFTTQGNVHGGSGFYGEIGTVELDASDFDMMGNEMPLVANSITKIVIPMFDCGSNTEPFTIQGFVSDLPVLNDFTTPTIHAVSDIFQTSVCTSTFPDDIYEDIILNFNEAPELTGTYLVGWRMNGADSEKFFPGWSQNEDVTKPLESCNCATPNANDVGGWIRWSGTPTEGGWTNRFANAMKDSEGEELFNFNMAVFSETEGGGGGGGGGEGEVGAEQCEQAKDTAWTVIGIMPVALFFGLFALFSSFGKPT